MKLQNICRVVGFLLVLSLVSLTVAQTSSSGASALPRLVRFGRTVTGLNGKPMTGVVGITFALYSEQTGGAPLWLETQNVTPDANGHYTVLLGSTKPDGLPAELFTSEQAHWVGVQVSGQPEQPRVLLVSAPYALKAGDAETIGGLPPSAFVLAGPANGVTSANAAATAPGASAPLAATDVTTTGGTVNFLPLFNGTSTVLDSAVFQSGTGATAKVGINTATPLTPLDVKGAATIRGILSLPVTGTATATAGKNSQPLSLAASAYNSTSSTALNQTFQWEAEPASNDTTSPSGTLNLLFGVGATKPSETGLHIASNGQITFAAGQTFPGGGGSGTVTSIATGLGLKGGPITTTGTLAIDTTKIPQLGVANAFTANQTLTGTLTATSSGGAGTIAATTTNATATAISADGVAIGMFGTASSTSGVAVEGDALATSGVTVGVFGQTNSTSGSGVQGVAQPATGATYGVEGVSNSPAGYGVYGANNAATGNAVGVQGATNSSGGYGVEGSSPNYVGVYGTGEYGVLGATNSTTALGVVGVLGTTNSTNNAAGVQGNAAGSTGISQGVYGWATSPAGVGVLGQNSATTGSAPGVYGLTSSSSGYGVEGASPSVGVYGTGAEGVVGVTNSVTGYGVQGMATSGSGSSLGVFGINDSPAGYAVYGENNVTAGGTAGVYGTTASPSGYGVEGAGPTGVLGEDTVGTGYGVYGSSSDGYGVVGNSGNNVGVWGNGTNGVYATGSTIGVQGLALGSSLTGRDLTNHGAGVWGDTGGTSGLYFGVVATTDTNTALLAENADSTGSFPTMVVANYTASANTHFPVFQTSSPNTYSNSRHCTIDTSANLTCTGLLTGSIQGSAGKETAVYAMQSAENWLEDAGSGQLSNGSARIQLDPAFAQTVNAGVEYHVFLTPNGDSRGLYVSQKTATSFQVHEQGGGTSSIAFDYRIMAKRKGYENVRLEDLTGRFKQPETPRQKMRRPLLPAEMKPVPRIPRPPVQPLVAPRPSAPMPVQPKAVPMPHPAARDSKPEATQK